MRLREILEKQTLFAFNCDDFVVYQGVVSAAVELNQPVIVQVSTGSSRFWGITRFAAICRQENADLFLNFDHGKSLITVKKAIDNDFDLIQVDGTDLKWEENISITKQAVELAYPEAVLVEGEPVLEKTTPEIAAEFAEKTGVDLIAVFVGNRHGIDPEKEHRLDFDQLRKIKQAVPDKWLTLHGASGVPDKDIAQAIKEGLVAKINVNTWLRNAYRRSLEKSLADYQGKFSVYNLMAPVVEEVKKEVIRILMIND